MALGDLEPLQLWVLAHFGALGTRTLPTWMNNMSFRTLRKGLHYMWRKGIHFVRLDDDYVMVPFPEMGDWDYFDCCVDYDP